MRRVTFLLLSLVAACNGGGSSGEPSPPPGGGGGEAGVASVTVAGSSHVLAVGETLSLTAEVFDAEGVRIPGVPVAWTSSDEGVASVDDDGRVRGEAPGTADITATAGGVRSAPYPVTVQSAPAGPGPVALTIAVSSLPGATAGTPYRFAFQAAGGTPPYRWGAAVISPDGQGNGLTLDPESGVLSGIPLFSGPLPLLVEVSDAASLRASVQFLLHVAGPGAGKSFTNAPPTAVQGVPYSFTFGTPWSGNLGCVVGIYQVFGKVPPGLSLDTLQGTLTGTPLTAGAYTFAFYADPGTTLCVDAPTQTNVTAFALDVAPSPVPSSPSGSSDWRRSGETPVLEPDREGWDSDYVTAPSVVKVGGTYYLYYEGQGGPRHGRAIGLATSMDGLQFTRSGSNPVLSPGPPGAFDAMEVRLPSVHHDGSTFRMWYLGKAAPSDPGAIGFATSSDGVTWSRHPGGPVFGAAGGPHEGAAPGQVLQDGSTFTLYYVDRFGSFGRATSSDGIHWEDQGPLEYNVTPSLSFTRPAVVKDGGTYRMWYMRRGDAISDQALGSTTAFEVGGAILDGWTANAIASAHSEDGVSWTLYEGNPVLVGSAGWDGPGVAYPSVLREGDVFRMWYAAGPVRDGSARGAIGLATGPAR